MKSLYFLILSSTVFTACAVLEVNKEVKPVTSVQKVYFAPFDQVWRAVTLSMVAYPIAVNNSDTGTLESDYVKGTEVFKSPLDSESKAKTQRYRLFLNVAKGQVNGKSSVRVTISKKIETQVDFFSSPTRIPSDGLEENMLLYRIDRELVINKAITAETN